jgi:DNA-binding NarL/FixJ family response regulator
MSMGMRVLLCDDVPELRLLLRLGLEDEPDVEIVGEAATGAEAVDMVATVAPDVVLLDFDMPVMSGAEALPRLRRLHPTPRVIAFVGAMTEAVEARAVALGAERCLDKSARMDAIAAAIRTPVAPAALAG